MTHLTSLIVIIVLQVFMYFGTVLLSVYPKSGYSIYVWGVNDKSPTQATVIKEYLDGTVVLDREVHGYYTIKGCDVEEGECGVMFGYVDETKINK